MYPKSLLSQIFTYVTQLEEYYLLAIIEGCTLEKYFATNYHYREKLIEDLFSYSLAYYLQWKDIFKDAEQMRFILSLNSDNLPLLKYGLKNYSSYINTNLIFQLAAYKDAIKCFHYLFDKKYYIDSDALYYLAQHGRLPEIKMILDSGRKFKIWMNPVYGALDKGHLKVVKYLVEEKDFRFNNLIDEQIAYNMAIGNVPCLKYLMDSTPKVTLNNNNLDCIVRAAHWETIKLVVERIGRHDWLFPARELFAKDPWLTARKIHQAYGVKGKILYSIVCDNDLRMVKYFFQHNYPLINNGQLFQDDRYRISENSVWNPLLNNVDRCLQLCQDYKLTDCWEIFKILIDHNIPIAPYTWVKFWDCKDKRLWQYLVKKNLVNWKYIWEKTVISKIKFRDINKIKANLRSVYKN